MSLHTYEVIWNALCADIQGTALGVRQVALCADIQGTAMGVSQVALCADIQGTAMGVSQAVAELSF